MAEKLAERFHALFAALDRFHGTYEVSARPVKPGEKVEGRAITVRGPVTVAEWERHLAGAVGLGLVPVTDDATCRFGAIDVDDYSVDLKRLARHAADLKLPLVPCRTKSGGCHLYLFLAEDASADLVRGKLMEWAVALGYSGVEIFPKQTKLAGPEDRGSWLNAPYQSGARTLRYALDKNGRALSPEEFLDAAESSRVTEAWLKEFKLPHLGVVDELLADGPPCLQTLAVKGFPNGTRNNGLFSIAVYLRKRFPDEWEAKLDVYNQKLMDPPLSSPEVSAIVKSAKKKDYSYRCNDQPIVSVCNRQICLSRTFGIGGGSDDPGVELGQLVKIETDPPTWLWDVNGARLTLETDHLLNQAFFRKAVFEQLTILTNVVKPGAWSRILNERLKRIEIQAVPKDVTPEGEWKKYLEDFISQKAQAQTLDEMLLKKPYRTEAHVCFRSGDFKEWLENHRVAGVTGKKIFKLLRELEAEHQFERLKGKGTAYWKVPTIKLERQTESFDKPKTVNGGGF